jgi:hypothetical protein
LGEFSILESRQFSFLKYSDSSGVLQTLDPSDYVVDAFRKPGLICRAYCKSRPATWPDPNAVQIPFIAAYVPPEVKHAIVLKIADLYERCGGDEGIDKNINEAIKSLLWPDRINILKIPALRRSFLIASGRVGLEPKASRRWWVFKSLFLFEYPDAG